MLLPSLFHAGFVPGGSSSSWRLAAHRAVRCMSALLGRWWRAAGAGRGWQAASNPPSRSCRDGTSFRVPKLPPLLLQRQIRSVHLCYPLFGRCLGLLCCLTGMGPTVPAPWVWYNFPVSKFPLSRYQIPVVKSGAMGVAKSLVLWTIWV